MGKKLLSNTYSYSNIGLRGALASVTKKDLHIYKLIVNKEKEETSLEAVLASKLISLDKNPDLRLVGVDEVS